MNRSTANPSNSWPRVSRKIGLPGLTKLSPRVSRASADSRTGGLQLILDFKTPSYAHCWVTFNRKNLCGTSPTATMSRNTILAVPSKLSIESMTTP